ncbi:MAG: hypothetical protein AAFR88_07690, partial [Pseudomonadota bacterium]
MTLTTILTSGSKSARKVWLMSAACLGLAALPMNAAAQTAAVPTSDNPFGLPDEINILGSDNPNMRTATAMVNGYVITGTDIEHRVALVTSASDVEVSEEELKRLRVQVLRCKLIVCLLNLIARHSQFELLCGLHFERFINEVAQ